MKVELFVLDCDSASSRITLNLPAIIGRGDNADLVIAHPEVSRQHCRLFWYRDTVHIQDLKSLNGTTIAGRIISNAESPILPEEHFSVGPVQFRISYSKQDFSTPDPTGSTARRARGGSSNSIHSAIQSSSHPSLRTDSRNAIRRDNSSNGNGNGNGNKNKKGGSHD